MKAIRMRIQKFSRPGVILMATVVAIITSIVVANATQSITTPNAAFVSYSLATGASSAAITPATNKSVLVMGCCTGNSFAAVGQVSLLHLPSNISTVNDITWLGLEPPAPTLMLAAAITAGSTSAAAAHIVWIDSFHQVDIQTASSDTILIHNGSSGARAGNVTLVW